MEKVCAVQLGENIEGLEKKEVVKGVEMQFLYESHILEGRQRDRHKTIRKILYFYERKDEGINI